MFDCVVVGDLHFKQETCNNLFKLAWFLVSEPPEDIDTLVVLGDVFDSKSVVVSFDLLQLVSKFFNLLSCRYKEIIVVQGNHDLEKFSFDSHLEFLRLNPKIEVITEPTLRGDIGFFPFLFNPVELAKWSRVFAEECTLCFTHNEFKGFFNNEFHKSQEGIDCETLPSLGCLFVGGHYHSPQMRSSKNVLILGSSIQVRADEVGQKKFYGILYEKKFRLVFLPAYVSQRYIEVRSKEDLKEVKGKYVVIADNVFDSLADDLREELSSESLGVKVKSSAQKEQSFDSGEVDLITKGVEELFKEFCEQREDSPKIGNVLLEDVCESG